MNRHDRIVATLEASLSPEALAVQDESSRHEGHAGWQDGGETHFRVRIVSPVFSGKSLLDRHRLVNAALAQEFESGLHALAIEAFAPGEGIQRR